MSSDKMNKQEIDIQLLFETLNTHRWKIVIGCVLGALVALTISFWVPVIYKSSVTVLPQEQDKELNAGGLMSGSLGNLANIAGVDIGGTSGSIKVNMEILRSRKFILGFINKYGLERNLIAAESWDRKTDSIGFDADIYDSQIEQWRIEDEFEDGKFRAPTKLELYDAFMERYTLSYDSDTGLLSISLTHPSPRVTKEWLTQLVSYANNQIRSTALSEAETKIAYLNEKIDNTRVESIKNIFYQLIESEIQHKMLIDTKEDFAFKTIDPSFLPEQRFAPKRLYYLVFGGLVTFFIIFSILLFRLVFALHRKSRS